MRLLPVFLLLFSCLAWGQSGRFIWPTQGKVINGFDLTRKGIDIAGKSGQPVVAASSGIVLYAKNMRGYGNMIIIDHGESMVTAYAHNKAILVREGQTVTQGQPIAEMGDSDSDTVKLRFQIRHMGQPIDPMALLVVPTNENQISSQEKSNLATLNQTGTVFWRTSLATKANQSWKHGGTVLNVAFSPDGKKILASSTYGDVILIDLLSGGILQSWKHEKSVRGIAFGPDGKCILTSSEDGITALRDIVSGKTLWTLKKKEGITSAVFSPDGKKILVGYFDRDVSLIDSESSKTLQNWQHENTIYSVAFSPDAKQILIGSVDGTVILRDLTSGEILKKWKHDLVVTSVAFSPNGKQLLTGSWDKTAVLRDVASGKEIHIWKHEHNVNSVSFSRDGRQVLSASWDKTAVLRDADSGKTVQIFTFEDSVMSAVISPDGQQALTGLWNSTVVLKNIKYPLYKALVLELNHATNTYQLLPLEFSNRKVELDGIRPIKDEFETVAQFNQRVAKWNAAAEKLNADIQAHYAKLGPLPLDKRTQAFERALSRAYGNPELHDVRYDPETARFFATLKASLDPEFNRLVSIPVPNDQAKAVKAKLTSAENGLEVELRVTDQNELIWGQPRVRLDGKIIVADYIDKDFVPPVTTAIASDPQLKTILPPPIATLPSSPDVKVIDDPNINKLQMEVLQKEREQAALAARESEEKRLRERLAELNRQTKPEFEDDLPKLLAKAPASKPNPKLHVLAIGINDYADVPDVPFADRSAQQFAEIAKKLLGAEPQNIIVLTDSQATLGRLLGRLNTLLNRLGPEDQLLFYYAGHGVPAKDGSGAFLLAQDGGSGSYEQLPLQLGHLYKAIAKSKVGQAKIFIDACFSGRSGKDTIVFEGIAPVVPKVDQSFPDSQRLAVLTAGRGDQFSNQDKARGHRLFSYHLMRLLLEDGAKLEIAQLHKRLRDVVLNESRRIGPEFEQEPDLQGNGRMVVFGTN
jgi:WD40 repeat protein